MLNGPHNPNNASTTFIPHIQYLSLDCNGFPFRNGFVEVKTKKSYDYSNKHRNSFGGESTCFNTQ
jgi:hypothetical protein